MGIIREPEGVDFVIKSRILTEGEEKELSDYIAKWKIENKKQLAKMKRIIAEPEGDDFVIKSEILTEEEERQLSEHIAKKKIENKKSKAK